MPQDVHLHESLARINRLVDAQASEVESLTREVALLRSGLSYRLGHIFVHGLRSKHEMRQIPASLRAVVLDARQKLQAERSAGESGDLTEPADGTHARTPSRFETRVRSMHTQGRSVKPAKEYVVAIICDEFTYNSLAPEFTLVPLTPTNWREQMDQHSPDLLLAESTWSGIDSSARPWKGKVYASTAFPRENRGALLDILKYCHRRGIPTAFWNKEDPTHFSDRRHDFVKTAALFDRVFTTAEECIEPYRAEHGIKDVRALPFATQPRLFNPFRAEPRSRDVVFAGSWYSNHTERSRLMESILDDVVDQGLQLKIYDRYYGSDDPLHQFPERFQHAVLPGVSHRQIAEVYKESIFGLNFNTVVDSRTMFARRVFELASSNTLVLSNYSTGVDDIFRDSVVYLDRDPTRLGDLTDAEISQLRGQALRTVLSNHTYAHRADAILTALGLPHATVDPTFTAVVTVHDPAEIHGLVDQFQAVRREDDRMLITLAPTMAPLDVARAYQDHMSEHIGVASLDYAPRVETTHFALIDGNQLPHRDRINDIMLHAAYMDEAWFPLDNHAPLTPLDSIVLNNVIGPSHRFSDALARRGHTISEEAYSV